ncbi:amidohydrolase family protein [Streptomyces sp. NPDC051219]|uniref:amidohydrolase family protein n=1 Tax=Streptomyces sp. NPDC051219 TaxID=3155283 RepID=UPI00341B2FD6
MRIDAHHHLWDLSRRPQSWMDGSWADPLRRTFTPADLQPELTAHGVDMSVAVQTSASYDETRELLATADGAGWIGAVVGWADLTDPGLPAVLAELRSGPGGERLRGIRHQVRDEPDPLWLVRPEVRRGLAAVADAGLVYDLLVTPRELPAAIEVVREVPQLAFVLDHAAKPAVAQRRWQPWADAITELAGEPHVSCKLSGLVTEADWEKWRPQEVLPYARHVLDAFGPHRVLFGSDWPVCTLAADYREVLALVEQATTHLTVLERAAVFGDTAARVYGLNTR